MNFDIFILVLCLLSRSVLARNIRPAPAEEPTEAPPHFNPPPPPKRPTVEQNDRAYEVTDSTTEQSPRPSEPDEPEMPQQQAGLSFPDFLQFQETHSNKKKQQPDPHANDLIHKIPPIVGTGALSMQYDPGMSQWQPAGQTSQNSVLVSQVLAALREEVKQMSEQRAAAIITQQCGSECTYLPSPTVPDFLLRDATPFLLTEGFYIKLRKNIFVLAGATMRLNNFYVPAGEGSFVRGYGLDEEQGTFRPGVAGVYSVTVNLLVRVKQGDLESIRLKHFVQVSVYALDQYHLDRRPSSQYISPIPQAKQFSIHFTTVLYLQTNAPLTISVENESNAKIIIQEDSQFSAHLIAA